MLSAEEAAIVRRTRQSMGSNEPGTPPATEEDVELEEKEDSDEEIGKRGESRKSAAMKLQSFLRGKKGRSKAKKKKAAANTAATAAAAAAQAAAAAAQAAAAAAAAATAALDDDFDEESQRQDSRPPPLVSEQVPKLTPRTSIDYGLQEPPTGHELATDAGRDVAAFNVVMRSHSKNEGRSIILEVGEHGLSLRDPFGALLKVVPLECACEGRTPAPNETAPQSSAASDILSRWRQVHNVLEEGLGQFAIYFDHLEGPQELSPNSLHVRPFRGHRGSPRQSRRGECPTLATSLCAPPPATCREEMGSPHAGSCPCLWCRSALRNSSSHRQPRNRRRCRA